MTPGWLPTPIPEKLVKENVSAGGGYRTAPRTDRLIFEGFSHLVGDGFDKSNHARRPWSRHCRLNWPSMDACRILFIPPITTPP